jgi:predicted component of type VI protein secretion system
MQILLRATKGELLGHRWLLIPGEYVIGRDPECQIRLSENRVNRRHCKLRVTSDRIFISDLGSSNRTVVANQCVSDERPLKNGDWFGVCRSVFQVSTYLTDVWTVIGGEIEPCDVSDEWSDDPIAHEDLLAAAGLTRPQYLALIEQDRQRLDP